MDLLIQKQEIIDWITTLDNPVIINDVYLIKEKSNFDFKEAFEKGMTSEEFRKTTTEFIHSLPWKK
jgi:hypothetical protein